MMDLGNIAFGTLFLSQLISKPNFNLAIATLGIFLLISAYPFATMLTKINMTEIINFFTDPVTIAVLMLVTFMGVLTFLIKLGDR